MTVNANVLMDRTPSQARAAAERAIAGLGEDIELSRAASAGVRGALLR